MASTRNLVVKASKDPFRAAQSKLVIAWAQDIETGQPKYILELTAEQRGAMCGWPSGAGRVLIGCLIK